MDVYFRKVKRMKEIEKYEEELKQYSESNKDDKELVETIEMYLAFYKDIKEGLMKFNNGLRDIFDLILMSFSEEKPAAISGN